MRPVGRDDQDPSRLTWLEAHPILSQQLLGQINTDRRRQEVEPTGPFAPGHAGDPGIGRSSVHSQDRSVVSPLRAVPAVKLRLVASARAIGE